MLSDNSAGYFTKSSRIGMSHSYTAEETRTSSYLNAYVTKCKISGVELTNYTKPDWYYCIVEDGNVFKFHPNEHIFYKLDLDKLVWVWKQSYASLINDTYLRFQEFSGFIDYYPHAADE